MEANALEEWGAFWRRHNPRTKSTILFITGGLLFSVMLALFKIAAETMHFTEVLFFRQLVIVLIFIPILAISGRMMFATERPGLQIVRIMLSYTAIIFGFLSLVNLPLADATTIGFSKTFIASGIAVLVLSEPSIRSRWIAMAIGFTGIIVAVLPDAGSGLNPWHVLCFLSAVFIAGANVLTRVLAQIDHPATLMIWQNLGLGILMLPPAIWFWSDPSLNQLMLLAPIGVLSALSQYLIVRAYRVSEATALAPLEYTQFVFATVIGLLAFGDWPTLQVWIGAALLFAGTIYYVKTERRGES